MVFRKRLLNALTALVCLLLLALFCFSLGHSFQGLSPVGDLLSPSRGLWRHRPTTRDDVIAKLHVALKDAGIEQVEIEIDENEVPHITANSDRALYFAQGFVTAYFRIWQMDFLSRITAGEVSEIAGEKALPIDRFFRRMRIPEAARASAELMNSDPITRGPLAAYSQGVNARISQLDLSSLPIEYRLFAIFPEPWSEVRTGYLAKYMTWDLTGYLYDFRLTATRSKLSPILFDLLFPIPPNMPGAILEGRKNNAENSTANESKSVAKISLHRWTDVPDEALPDQANGSNSWAVPANRMKNRRVLLANDLHLRYALPSLWFTIQLTTPTMNVYGGSLPGAPGVIVGFTETMGWAVTNGTDDVLDWYSLRFRDEKRQEYFFDNTWRPVILRDEEIKIAGGKTEILKTRETHVGPIVFDEGDSPALTAIPVGLAPQWTGYIPSNEIRSFLLLNRAATADDCKAALKDYISPGQNFTCADRSGKIAYRHSGVFPVRKGRDGRFVIEATSDDDLWRGFLPPEESPAFETTTDVIVTANQSPIEGEALKKFGWFFAAPFRALEIRSKIESKKEWLPEEMIAVQADQTSWLAQNFKRIVLREVEKPSLKKEWTESVDSRMREEIRNWNGDFGPTNTQASLMQAWLRAIENATWTRVIGDPADHHWPGLWQFFEAMDKSPEAEIWDDPATPEKEDLAFRLSESLKTTISDLKANFGSKIPEWSEYQATTLNHAAKLPGFGRTVKAGGVAESPFANKGHQGPTWKLIVSFEDQPQAWNVIPGGQSGDPASLSYDNLLGEWSRGEMRKVNFKMREKKTK